MIQVWHNRKRKFSNYLWWNKDQGKCQKIYKKFVRTEQGKIRFTCRVIYSWNLLPDKVINSPSVNAFKSNLSKQWRNHPQQLSNLLSLSKTSPGFYVSTVQVFRKQCGKRKKCSSIFFPTVFSILLESFPPFFSNLKLSSATLSVWNSPTFVVWERVKERTQRRDGPLQASGFHLAFVQ